MDFCKPPANAVNDKTVQDVAVLGNKHNQIIGIHGLPQKESYSALSPVLRQLHERNNDLALQVHLSPCHL